jgi:hypothetical protein
MIPLSPTFRKRRDPVDRASWSLKAWIYSLSELQVDGRTDRSLWGLDTLEDVDRLSAVPIRNGFRI